MIFSRGFILAISAFILWGFFPFYFKSVAHIPALEVLSNRIVWGVLSLLLLLALLKNYANLHQLFSNTKQVLLLFCSSALIAANWGTYIWAVENNYIFQASLGYYINPLVNIALGFFILGERLRKIQWFAVLLATIGVSIQVIQFGEVPWIALSLAFSFGLYGLVHKLIKVESIPGLFIETLLLLPVALVYLAYLGSQSSGPVLWEFKDWGLLLLAGPVTVVPLLLYLSALKHIRYSIMGILEYIVPSMLFLLAAFYYKEPFNLSLLTTFGFIWVALLIISIDSLKERRSHIYKDLNKH